MSSSGCTRLTGKEYYVYGITSRLISLASYASENVNKLLVGNKSDLVAKRAVTTEQGLVSFMSFYVPFSNSCSSIRTSPSLSVSSLLKPPPRTRPTLKRPSW